MANLIVAFVSGVLFAVGLVVANVTDPATIVGFLDLFGNWNPSLGLVVGGAVLTAGVGQYLARRRSKPVFDACYAKPASDALDKKLVIGAALFGIGWGLGGYCPAPAVAGSVLTDFRTLVFILGMLLGMLTFSLFYERE